MIVRAFQEQDIEQLKVIHKKFFSRDYPLPDFLEGYVCAFTILADDGLPIIFGGVRPIAEAVLVTNKDVQIKERRKALLESFNISTYLAQKAGFDQLHAFIQDEKWLTHLKKHGFENCKGTPIFIGLKHG